MPLGSLRTFLKHKCIIVINVSTVKKVKGKKCSFRLFSVSTEVTSNIFHCLTFNLPVAQSVFLTWKLPSSTTVWSAGP